MENFDAFKNLDIKIFSDNLQPVLTATEADIIIGSANWDFIEEVIEEFSVIVEEHGLREAVKLYKALYEQQFEAEKMEKLGTEFSLFFVGYSIQGQYLN